MTPGRDWILHLLLRLQHHNRWLCLHESDVQVSQLVSRHQHHRHGRLLFHIPHCYQCCNGKTVTPWSLLIMHQFNIEAHSPNANGKRSLSAWTVSLPANSRWTQYKFARSAAVTSPARNAVDWGNMTTITFSIGGESLTCHPRVTDAKQREWVSSVPRWLPSRPTATVGPCLHACLSTATIL